MNISKLIAKFVLAFLVFSSISVQGPVFAMQNNEPPVTQSNQQEFEEWVRNDNIRKRGEWAGMLTSMYGFAVSASLFYNCYCTPDDNRPTKIKLAAAGLFCAGAGAYCMYNFLKARVWGR